MDDVSAVDGWREYVSEGVAAIQKGIVQTHFTIP